MTLLSFIVLSCNLTLSLLFCLLPALQPAVTSSTNPWGSVPYHQQQQQQNSQAGFATAGWPSSQAAASSYSNPFSSTVSSHGPMLNGGQPTVAGFPASSSTALAAHGRSHSIDTGEMTGLRWQQGTTQPRHNASSTSHVGHNGASGSSTGSGTNTSVTSNPWPTSAPPVPSSSAQGPGMDPFDVAWAAKSVNTASPNPFSNKSVKQFEVQL